ncbi:hypothetical protein N9Y92_03940 [Chlamydiales bacterium]|nr:hypothetical protein [Chlamydiales bacterium]
MTNISDNFPLPQSIEGKFVGTKINPPANEKLPPVNAPIVKSVQNQGEAAKPKSKMQKVGVGIALGLGAIGSVYKGIGAAVGAVAIGVPLALLMGGLVGLITFASVPLTSTTAKEAFETTKIAAKQGILGGAFSGALAAESYGEGFLLSGTAGVLHGIASGETANAKGFIRTADSLFDNEATNLSFKPVTKIFDEWIKSEEQLKG